MMETSLRRNANCHLREVMASGGLTANPEIAVTFKRDPRNTIIPMLDTRDFLFPYEYVTVLDG